MIGVAACVTILPSLILVLDKALEKTKHKALLPDLKGTGKFVTKHYKIFIILFLAVLFPAIYGYGHTAVYYNLDETLPKTLPGIAANEKLQAVFDMNAAHMLLVSADMPAKEIQEMTDEINSLEGIKWVLGLNSIKGPAIPGEIIPEALSETLENDTWQLLLIGSQYKVATDEVNMQCDRLNEISKRYDPSSM